MKDATTMKGRVRLVLTKADGTVIEDEFDNLVVTAGKNHAAARMSDTPPTAMSHLAVGTGATAPAAGDTALQTELYREVCASINVASNTIQFATTLAPGEATGSLTEAGIFNAGSGGTMLSRVTFTAKNKDAGDTLGITWTITFS